VTEDEELVTGRGLSVGSRDDLDVGAAQPYGQRLDQDRSVIGAGFGHLHERE
jgi:hypothetical protein